MSDATKRLMTDAMGQQIRDALHGIREAIVTPKAGTLYGFHIDPTESDPEDAVTYVADAVGMTPAKMNFSAGTFNYGSWGNAFFMPRPCVLKFDGTVEYYLNPNDYTKKYGGGDATIGSGNTTGNVMMEWGQNGKRIWYKIVPDADPAGCTVYIADYQADQDFRCWSFINNQGEMVDHFYTPVYNGYKDGNSKMRSLSGVTPTASQNAATERTQCRANNTTYAIWDTEVFCDVILIDLLLVLMAKSLDTQAAYGAGNTTGQQAGVLTTGTGDALGLFFGYNSDTTKVVKVFGMENWWGNLWRRFGGLVNDNGTMRYKLTRGTQDGSGASDYVVSTTAGDYSGYLQGGAIPASGWQKKQNWGRYVFAPGDTGGSDNHYYSDYFWSNNGQVDYACRGGCAVDGSRCGAWCLSLYGASSHAYWDIAAAPSCKPLS